MLFFFFLVCFFDLSAHLESIEHNIAFLHRWPCRGGLTCPPVSPWVLLFTMLASRIVDTWCRTLECHLSTSAANITLQSYVCSLTYVLSQLKVRRTLHYAILLNCSALWFVASLGSVVPLFSQHLPKINQAESSVASAWTQGTRYSSEGPLSGVEGGYFSYLLSLLVEVLSSCPICQCSQICSSCLYPRVRLARRSSFLSWKFVVIFQTLILV